MHIQEYDTYKNKSPFLLSIFSTYIQNSILSCLVAIKLHCNTGVIAIWLCFTGLHVSHTHILREMHFPMAYVAISLEIHVFYHNSDLVIDTLSMYIEMSVSRWSKNGQICLYASKGWMQSMCILRKEVAILCSSWLAYL